MLAHLLSAVRSARDLTPLFTHLGYEPPLGSTPEGVVAHWRGFRVVAADDADPVRRARAIARDLSRRAECALAVAVGPGELALAAPRLGGGPAPIVRVDPRDASTAHQLEGLRPRDTATALAHALRVADVLSSERVGSRFFAAFRVMLERMAASLDGRLSAGDRRLATLLALTRVLFLYFIQAKGWLDGRSDYLPALLDRSLEQRRAFHRTALHPLFFGTLNRAPQARSHRLDLGAIPYLNGGLFEPHPVERRIGPVLFSNALWRDAFDTLFERFRFCAREGTEVGAIAPDMLGHVFERVMESGERHTTGTFYTPDTVVRQIVAATIAAALPDPSDHAALRRIRVLDPAAGSGAFLLGALSRLTELRSAIEQPESSLAIRQIRLDILRHNLFGVDVSPVAVRLAELRLWLAVVADDPTDDIASITPLPNLDGIVRQGDTLIDPLGLARAWGLAPSAPQASMLAVSQARRRFFSARGPARAESARALREAERSLARTMLSRAFCSANEALRDLAAKARGADLFGRRMGLDAVERRRWDTLQDLRRTLRRALARLKDDSVPFFSFETHAPDVVAEGGFSVVVGNPPWVRAERLSAVERRALSARFSLWRARAGKGFAHQPDLAVAFMQRALELTRPAGAVGFLIPSKVATAQYGEAVRAHLVRETEIVHVHRVPDREANAFAAATYPLAIVVRNTPPRSTHSVQLGLSGAETISQQALAPSGPWVLVPDRVRDALERFRASGQPLSQVAPPGLGVKTGADQVFVGRVVHTANGFSTVRFADSTVVIESELLRLAVRGRDLRPFRVAPATVLLWGYTGSSPRASVPRQALAHLTAHRRELQQRADHRDGPLWSLFRTGVATKPHRVAWADIARQPAAVALDSVLPEAIPLNTCYVASFADGETALAFSAVFNSSWAAALFHVTADEARGGYRRLNARVSGLVPVPPAGPHFSALVSLAASAHRSHHVSQSDLDAAVAAALGLPENALRPMARIAQANSRR